MGVMVPAGSVCMLPNRYLDEYCYACPYTFTCEYRENKKKDPPKLVVKTNDRPRQCAYCGEVKDKTLRIERRAPWDVCPECMEKHTDYLLHLDLTKNGTSDKV